MSGHEFKQRADVSMLRGSPGAGNLGRLQKPTAGGMFQLRFSELSDSPGGKVLARVDILPFDAKHQEIGSEDLPVVPVCCR